MEQIDERSSDMPNQFTTQDNLNAEVKGTKNSYYSEDFSNDLLQQKSKSETSFISIKNGKFLRERKPSALPVKENLHSKRSNQLISRTSVYANMEELDQKITEGKELAIDKNHVKIVISPIVRKWQKAIRKVIMINKFRRIFTEIHTKGENEQKHIGFCVIYINIYIYIY